ncbi:MAG TPA: hypothetical protein VF524_02300 [Polyangia bacterium]
MASGDSVDPGGKLSLAAKMLEASVDGDENVLRGIFPFIHRDADGGGEAVNKWRISVVKAPPSGRVPSTTGPDELGVGE